MHIYNRQEFAYAVTADATRSFVEAMGAELDKGRGFLPLIGAGLSAPSGVPLLREVTLYLHRCIGLALGLEEEGMRPWNPRLDQWPDLVEGRRLHIKNWFNLILGHLRDLQQASDRWEEARVCQEALGAMADWRTSLLFLSRLRRLERFGKPARPALILDAPEREVIDGFFRHVTADRYASLGHHMLANLAIRLRISIVATTNFDDLLESAFRAAQVPLEVFEVHLESGLPPYSAMPDTARSLVKLHGNRHSLRADYSVDALPSEDDRWRFLDYFVKPSGRERSRGGRDGLRGHVAKHLLVLGMGAKETRTLAFVRHLWQNMPDEFQLFWLCHSLDDVATIARVHEGMGATPAVAARRLHVLRHTNIGLFLLHAGQLLDHSLPAKRVMFPAVPKLPLPPLRSQRGGDPKAAGGARAGVEAAYVTQLYRLIQGAQGERYRHPKIVFMASEPAVLGVTSAAAIAFERLQSEGQNALWLDMNDVANADDLFEQVTDAAYSQLGEEEWMPVFLEKDPRPRTEEVQRLTSSTREPWVIFINARETPGANHAAYPGAASGAEGALNGWLDNVDQDGGDPGSDRTRNARGFYNLIVELTGQSTSPHLTVVVLCRLAEGDASHLAAPPGGPELQDLLRTPLLREAARQGLVAADRNCLVAVESCADYASPDVVINVVDWLGRPGGDAAAASARIHFLHALVEMQCVRHLSVIWGPAAPPRADGYDPLAWIGELEETGLVRWKLGGFIWLHSHARNAMRVLLSQPPNWKKLARDRFGIAPATIKAAAGWSAALARRPTEQVHWDLAAWYHAVILATQAPHAVFEAMYHACTSAEVLLRVSLGRKERRRKERLRPDLAETVAARVNWAATILQTFAFLVQTHGHSRGSCRRLDYLRGTIAPAILALAASWADDRGGTEAGRRAITDAATALRLRCTESMRNIAREVAEDSTAYLRLRQLREIYCDRAVTPAGWGASAGDFEARSRRDAGQAIHWLRWWRWAGMLGIASRSYPQAERALYRCFEAVAPPAGQRGSDAPLAAVIRKVVPGLCVSSPAVFDNAAADPQAVRIEIARCIEQYSYLQLLRISVDARLAQLGYGGTIDPEPARPDPVVAAGSPDELGEVVLAGLQLAESAIAHDRSTAATDTQLIYWIKSRLLLHYSIVTYLQGRHGTSADRLARPFEHLAHAERCLALTDPRRNQTDLAVVDLYRADLCLRDAWATRLATATFGEACRELSTQLHTTYGWRSSADGIRRSRPLRELADPQAASLVQAKLADAVRYLDQANRILRTRRRNVWWATWYFQRRLTSIAMWGWAAVTDQATPIPFLGLEAALRKSKTIADQTLEDALRMVRYDSYRLATIVDAYGQCALGLQYRLMFDQQQTLLHHRQVQMHENLDKAVGRLSSVHARRSSPPLPPPSVGQGPPRHDVSPEVDAYVRSTIRSANQRIDVLKDPIN